MIFDLRGQPLCRGIERWPFGDGPGKQKATPFETKIIMQVRGLMFLNHELEIALRRSISRMPPLGLLRHFKIPLAPVLLQVWLFVAICLAPLGHLRSLSAVSGS